MCVSLTIFATPVNPKLDFLQFELCDLRSNQNRCTQGGICRGTVDVSRSPNTYPTMEVNFVSKGWTLEIPLIGAFAKVDKFCCFANNAIVQFYRLVSLSL